MGRNRLLAAVIGVAAIACHDVSSPDLSSVCTVPVTIQIGAGPQPAVSWAPVCGATSVTVTDPAAVGAVPVWYLTAVTQLIPPPIQYATLSPGATGFVTAESLTVGRSYTIYIERGLRGDPKAGVDSLTFFAH